MIRAGIIGVGFMGWIHWLAYQRSQLASCAAVCSRDPKKQSGDWTEIQGNFGPRGEHVDLSQVRVASSLEELLADEQLDLIDICLPPHLHVETAIRALEAGKHVLCEKPMALTTQDCDRMLQAAARADRMLLIGQVLPFFPEYAKALELIEAGGYGKLLGGSFKRIISDPQWLPDFFNPETVGGPLVDLHVHDAHLIRYLFGMPERVHCQGRFHGDVVAYGQTLFQFRDPQLVVGAVSGVIDQQGRPFTHGFEIHLERATLQYELAVVGGEGRTLLPLTVYGADGKVETPELAAGDEVTAFVAELDEAARAIESGQPSSLLSGQLARDAIALCHCQTQSARERASVATQ